MSGPNDQPASGPPAGQENTAPPAPQEPADPEAAFQEWREKLLAQYESQLGMTRDQVINYLSNRPLPRGIIIAAVLVGAVLVYALTQAPKYIASAVSIEQAKHLIEQQHYDSAARVLENANRGGFSPHAAKFLYAKVTFMTGMPSMKQALQELGDRGTRDEADELEDIFSQWKAAAPCIKAGRKALEQDNANEAVTQFEAAVREWPSSCTAHVGLASAYLMAHCKSPDDRYKQRCEEQLARVREMFPRTAGDVVREVGSIDSGKAVYQLASKAQQSLDAGRVDQAIEMCRNGLKMRNDSSKAHAVLAVAYARKFEQTRDPQFRTSCISQYKTAVKLNDARKSFRSKLGALAKEVD